GVPLKRRLAPAKEAGLIGQDFDENPVPHAGVADEGLYRGDFHAVIGFTVFDIEPPHSGHLPALARRSYPHVRHKPSSRRCFSRRCLRNASVPHTIGGSASDPTGSAYDTLKC